MLQKSESPNPSSTFTLPASAEQEWRFSYQFTSDKSNRMVRVVVGVGLLTLMIVAGNAAW